jgi:hypothetical protein
MISGFRERVHAGNNITVFSGPRYRANDDEAHVRFDEDS